jgi:hypothetical protein
MKRSTEFKVAASTSVLIVGDPGTRKTSLALHFPRPYIFDADSNLTGPVRHYKDMDFLYDDGHTVSRDWKNSANRIDYKAGDKLQPQHKYMWMVVCINEAAESDEVDTIVLDSLTSIVDMMVSEVKRQQGRKETDEMRIQDWGKLLYLMKHLVTTLKTCSKTSVFTCHNLIDKDETDGRYKTFLAVPGQSKNILAALFNDVWGTYIKQTGPPNNRQYEYRVRTMPNGDCDHRGIKGAMGLEKTMAWEDVAKLVTNLGTKAEEKITPLTTNTSS